MLKFRVFENAEPAKRWPLRNAHLVGADGSAMRATIGFENGTILCEKREQGSAALVLQHAIDGVGELTLPTCLLPEHDEPYILEVELARHRLMLLYVKEEEWSMFDLSAEHPILQCTEQARSLFIEALCAQKTDPVTAAARARESLAMAVKGSEELALYHSQLLMNRRRGGGGSRPRFPFGCGVALEQRDDRLRRSLLGHVDFVQLPTSWRDLAPEEGEYRWQLLDDWVEWASRNRLPILAGPLVSFETHNLPDWLFIWEHDFETIRDLIYEHVEQVVGRYRNKVSVWKVASGLHINRHFSFNFDQLMDLTRMTTMRVKKLAPQARALVEVREPFGEYYAANQRSIPPMTYVDLLIQSGMSFDGFSAHLLMGQAQGGQYTRDLMQLSALLDQFAGYGKTLYLTLGAPSEPVTQMMLPGPESGQPPDDNAGHWRMPWSPMVQGHWLEAMMQIAASKPFVEAAAWCELIDHPHIELPLSGLVSEAFEPKPAFRKLAAFRRLLATPPAADEPATAYASLPQEHEAAATEPASQPGIADAQQ